MEKPLPSRIPLARIISPFLLIGALAALLTWRLSTEMAPPPDNSTFSRLLRQDEIVCEWPRFSVWDHAVRPPSNHTVPSIECASMQFSYASLDSDGFITITPPFSLTPEQSHTRCVYSALKKDDKGRLELYDESEMPLSVRVRAKHDKFVLRCSNGTQLVYEEAFFNPRASFQSLPSRSTRDASHYAPADPYAPSLAILIVDDLSRAHAARNLPKTMRLMMDEEFMVPSRYAQSFPDVASNLDLLLNGNDSSSLAEAMRDRGCLVLSNEETLSSDDSRDLPRGDIDASPLHDFNRERRLNEHCLASGESFVSSLLSPLLSFSSSNNDICTLSLSRLRSPVDRQSIATIDDQLSSALRQLISTTNNTAIFIVSPSGLKGRGLSGVAESRSPLLAAYFPLQFRKARNEHYSAFSWNMDKFFTTRDVYSTLHQLASGDLPPIIEWAQPDEPPVEVTSLLAEMLPEERNCTNLGIPAENCVCLGTDEKRNATINAEGVLYQRVFDLVESRALQEECVEAIETDNRLLFINSYQMIGREMDKEANDVEWLTIKFYVKILKKYARHGGNYGAGSEDYVRFKTTVRHYISSGRLEYVEAVIFYSFECFAVHLERMCSLCYSTRFWSLSSPGPAKGFLLDTATALV